MSARDAAEKDARSLYGLNCVTTVEGGRPCPCESHPNVPSALPFMDKHGNAFCECHSASAERFGLMPFSCCEESAS